jgi:hypothetical protein
MTAPGHDHGASPASDGAAAGMRGGLVEFATRRRVTIAMCTVTLLLFGLIALGNLKVNLLPDLSYPTLTVRTEYTGAAPTEIETLITQPVEEAVGVVKNLRKLKSVSRTGQSDVVLEFAWGTNMDQASLEVRDKMEALNLPLEAKAPVLLRFNPSTEPIMRLVLSNKVAPTSDADAVRELTGLRRYADEDLKKKLEPVTGVAAVKVGGGLEDEIQVDIDQQKLAQLNLPIDTVIKRLKDENINISGGRLEEGSQRFLVRTVNQFADLEEIRNLLVTTQAVNGSAADSALQQMFNIAASTGSAAAIAAAGGAERIVRRWLQRGRQRRAGAPEGRGHRAPGLQGARSGDPPGRQGIGRAGHLQGRRRQHRVHRRSAAQAPGADQGHVPVRRRDDHHRGPVALHRARHRRRQEGCGDRRPAGDPDHLPVPARWLEHVRDQPVAAGLDHRHVLLHGPARPELERDVAGRPGAGHRPGGG